MRNAPHNNKFLKYFQYRLITLLLIPAFASIPSLYLGWRLQVKAIERRAALAIRSHGGDTYTASELDPRSLRYSVPGPLVPLIGADFFDPVVKVSLGPNIPGNSLSLERLVDLPQIQTLVLDGTEIRDDDLIYLQRLADLRRLYMEKCKISDCGLKVLASCSNLVEIDASDTGVSGVGVAELTNLEELSTLFLNFCPVDDDSARSVSKLRQLRYLSLYGTGISDKGLAALAVLDRIQILNIGKTQVTGSGLPHLSDCTSLRTLELHDTKLDDSCVQFFVGLTQLANLNLIGTQITDSGVKRLRRLLPNCRIDVQTVTKRAGSGPLDN